MNDVERLAMLTSPALKGLMEAGHDRLIVPIGATEQHGPHLPNGTDMTIAEAIAERVCAGRRVILAPGIAYGYSHVHDGFPGTVSVSPLVLIPFIAEVAAGYLAMGFRTVVLLNSHGKNRAIVWTAAQQAMTDAGAGVVIPLTVGDFTAGVDDQTGPVAGSHATRLETAIMMAVDAPSVVSDLVSDFVLDSPSNAAFRLATDLWLTREHSATGVMGSPTGATAQLGLKAMDVVEERITKLIVELEAMNPRQRNLNRSEIVLNAHADPRSGSAQQ